MPRPMKTALCLSRIHLGERLIHVSINDSLRGERILPALDPGFKDVPDADADLFADRDWNHYLKLALYSDECHGAPFNYARF